MKRVDFKFCCTDKSSGFVTCILCKYILKQRAGMFMILCL